MDERFLPVPGRPRWRPYPPSDDRDHTVTGTVRVLRGVSGPRPRDRRPVWVYLPPSHGSDRRSYPVLYMQDGQNLFDDAISFAGEWRVDEAMETLAGEGIEAIVVGVANLGPRRSDEYGPLPEPELGGGEADAYLDFLTGTVKPLVDGSFRTRAGPRDTGILGSSLGGLLSLYAFFLRPEVFGFAGALSPALWFGERGIFRIVGDAEAPPGRIYLDVGRREGHRSVRDVRRMCRLLERKGYRRDEELLCVKARGAGHDETAWARRFPGAARFLLGGRGPE